MRQRLSEYVIELMIVLSGLIAATLESVLVQRSDIALLIAFMSAILALSVMAIRSDIKAQLRDLSSEQKIIDQIPDARWQEEARSEIEHAHVRYSSWASGTRQIDERSSLNFQIAALAQSTTLVYAIHLALDRDSLAMWDDRQRGFDRLVDAYRLLPSHVVKRRVLVLDADDASLSQVTDGRRTIVDLLTQRVCQLQATPVADGGVGFDLRISWTSVGARDVADILIVDGREVFSIESYGHGHFSDLEVCVNHSVIQHRMRQFDDLWTDSTPVQHCLPPVP